MINCLFCKSAGEKWNIIKEVQDATQNFVHTKGFMYLPFEYQNYYLDYVYFNMLLYVFRVSVIDGTKREPIGMLKNIIENTYLTI